MFWRAAGLVLFTVSCLPGEQAVAVDVNTNGARVSQTTAVSYPAEAIAKRIEGTVAVLLKVDDRGFVADATVISGPDDLSKAVLQSVKNWQFAADVAGTTQQVTVSFHIFGESPSRTPQAAPQQGLIDTLQALPPPPPFPAVPPSIAGIPRIIVDGSAQAATLISQQPYPVYPSLAKAARVQGVVRFQAVIGIDGHVYNLQVLSGPPLLVRAALDSVQQWLYRPTLVDGNPVEVITTIDVRFTLADQ